MKVRLGALLVATASLALVLGGLRAEDVKSGPDKKIGGAFQVKAITGAAKDTQLCYVCKYNAEARPAVVLIFTQKADANLAAVVKAVDSVQKNNAKLGTVVVGVGGVEAADLTKLQDTYKLTTPLTVAVDKDGPKAYKLNPSAAMTVLVYQKGGTISRNFAFTTTKAAAAKAGEIAAAAQDVLK
jgi:predicted metalloprotease with PDZ domain